VTRVVGRRRELAIRVALGASKLRLARLLAVESALLVLASGAGALLVAAWVSGALAAIRPLPTVTLRLDTRLDWRVLAFLAALLVAVAGALAAAGFVQAMRSEIGPALKEDSAGSYGGRSVNWVRGGMVTLQVMASLFLLVGAALFTRSLAHAEATALGFDPADVAVLDVDHARTGDPAAARTFFAAVVRRLSADSRVEAAAVSTRAPLDSSTPITHVAAAGPVRETANLPTATFLVVGPAYFDVVRTPLVEGRAFVAQDDERRGAVAIVNETLARRLWPDGSAVGRRLWLDDWASPSPAVVVGVAANSRYLTLGEEGQAHVYLPFAQQPKPGAALLVRTREPARVAFDIMRDALAAEDASVQGFFARTLREHVAVASLPVRLASRIARVVAVLAGVLSALGVYALVSFTVAERTQELGLRLALGAAPADVFRVVMRDGMRLVAVGLAIGVPATMGGTRLLGSLLYGVSPTDPATFAGATALLVVVAAVACAVPAIRVTRIDPLIALRRP
jgi:predicted permease